MEAFKAMRRVKLTILTVFFSGFGGFAAEDDFSFSGYLKSTVQASQFADSVVLPPLEDDKSYWLWQNTLNLRLFYEPDADFSFETVYELSPVVADANIIRSQGFFNPVDSPYRVKDLTSVLEENGDLFFFQNLDRLNMTVRFQAADLRIGRQPISFGSGRYINPTDIFSPFVFQDLNQEEKNGVDAVRYQLMTGDMSELDIGVVFGEDAELAESAAFVRGKVFYKGSDISLMLMDFKQNLMIGFDLTRSIGEAGFWFEAAQVYAGLFEGRESDDDYFRLTTGFDYSLNRRTYGFIEYHYNGAGARNPESYLINMVGHIGYTEGGLYLLGKNYLIPGVTYEINPLTFSTLYLVTNMDDFSTYLGVSVEYNLKENCYLEAGGFFGFGRSPDRSSTELELNSEFGAYSNAVYVGLRYYF